ncbi:MAG: hypothetical protein ACKVT1_04755 [Dehalococcoidia bacterium]
MSTAERLYDEAMQLPEQDRVHLAERLLDSVEPEFSPEFIAQIHARDEEMNRGDETVGWAEIRDEWQAKLKARAASHLA